ncbi:hypothetical protein, partial [Klebsiella pneumoniae]|uniref:hypothetical protein n=1 Tax=Klebsiella pneumoniae TaxID=573 RepID=UPI0021D2AD65
MKTAYIAKQRQISFVKSHFSRQLDEERDQLLSEVQERMTLSGQLDPVLAENDTAAGRLWDMSAG